MTRPSILFWIVGVFCLLWCAFGVFDGYMTFTQNEEYLKDYPEEMVAYWFAMPDWRYALWAIGLGTAAIASVLFLMRRALAAPLFAIGPVCMIIGLAHDKFNGGWALYGTGGLAFSFFILLVTVAITWYAYRQKAMGVLR